MTALVIYDRVLSSRLFLRLDMAVYFQAENAGNDCFIFDRLGQFVFYRLMAVSELILGFLSRLMKS